MLRRLVARVELSERSLRAEVAFANLADATSTNIADQHFGNAPRLAIDAPIQMRRRGAELRIVLQDAAAPQSIPDTLLIRNLIEARTRVADYVHPDKVLTVSDIARRNGGDVGDVSRSLQLAFLAPDIVEGILDETQPISLTTQRLKRIGELPLLWEEQRELLG